MSSADTNQGTPVPSRNQFATTHWSVVLAAGATTSPSSGRALQELCQTYWFPLYAWVRRRGYGAADAQDLTQAFFARLLNRRDLRHVNREGGKFRSFLLTALTHFLRDEWDKLRAAKRGGGHEPFSLDGASAETRYRLEPRDDLTADKLLEKQWALSLLERALNKLQEECAANGKQAQFEMLQPLLTEDVPDGTCARLAESLNVTPNAVAVMLRRFRQRYRELVRMEIAATVDSGGVDDEMRALLAALR